MAEVVATEEVNKVEDDDDDVQDMETVQYQEPTVETSNVVIHDDD